MTNDLLVDSLTDEESEWITTSRHHVARRIRFFAIVLASWPSPVPPFDLVGALILAMRYGQAGKSDLRPRDLRSGVSTVRAARRLRVPLETLESARLWHGIVGEREKPGRRAQP